MDLNSSLKSKEAPAVASLRWLLHVGRLNVFLREATIKTKERRII